jgi:Ca2+-binding EF-hand superfamily protein
MAATAAISFTAVTLPTTEAGAMRAIFDAVDTDGNGSLDRDEVTAFIQKLRPSRYLDVKVQEMDGRDSIGEIMAEMDADSDGTVSYEEFEAWWQGGGSLTAAERDEQRELRRRRHDKTEALRAVFNSLDSDGNGTLDRDEVRAAFTKLGHVFESRSKLDDAMYEMDTDCSGTVSFDEFANYWRAGLKLSKVINVAVSLELEAATRTAQRESAASLMQALETVAPTAMRQLFDSVDTDNSGTLDVEEVARFIRKLKPTKALSAAGVAEAMAEMDGDGDGSVSYDEFEGWWRGGGSLTTAECVDSGCEKVGDALAESLKALEKSRLARAQVMGSAPLAAASPRRQRCK